MSTSANGAVANHNDDVELEFDKEGKIIDAADIDIVDDTPAEDRGRKPLPKEIVDELEADELEEYSDKVKTRLKQMKKVWHDERREKEAAKREQQEAVTLARQIMDENKRLKATLQSGEKTFMETFKSAADLEQEAARREYKEAYEAGDADKVIAAQEKLQSAVLKQHQIKNFRPTPLQKEESELQLDTDKPAPVKLDPKTQAWQERNKWYGANEEMTSLALGVHQKLVRERGTAFAGTDDYWQAVDKTMRQRFPEEFEEAQTNTGKPSARTENRPATTVVAPATRSTSSKKIVLKQSQINLAKKLGLSPEQYAREQLKLEKH